MQDTGYWLLVAYEIGVSDSENSNSEVINYCLTDHGSLITLNGCNRICILTET